MVKQRKDVESSNSFKLTESRTGINVLQTGHQGNKKTCRIFQRFHTHAQALEADQWSNKKRCRLFQARTFIHLKIFSSSLCFRYLVRQVSVSFRFSVVALVII